jgi:SAM-dependent methyltransferase
VEYCSYTILKEGELTIDAPDASYDVVYLTRVLEHYDLESRRKLIKECARVTKNSGRIVAFSPACDDAREAYELLEPYGVDTKEFLKRRLTNRDIASLKPHEAVFFQDIVVPANRDRLLVILKSLGLDAKLEHLWTAKKKFPIKRFFIGMVWHVARK